MCVCCCPVLTIGTAKRPLAHVASRKVKPIDTQVVRVQLLQLVKAAITLGAHLVHHQLARVQHSKCSEATGTQAIVDGVQGEVLAGTGDDIVEGKANVRSEAAS